MSESGPDIFCGGGPTTIVLELLRDRFGADLFRAFQATRIKTVGQMYRCVSRPAVKMLAYKCPTIRIHPGYTVAVK